MIILAMAIYMYVAKLTFKKKPQELVELLETVFTRFDTVSS